MIDNEDAPPVRHDTAEPQPLRVNVFQPMAPSAMPQSPSRSKPLARLLRSWSNGSCTSSGSMRVSMIACNGVCGAIVSAPTAFIGSMIFESNQFREFSDPTWIALGAVLYTAIATSIVGHGGWYWLLQRYKVGQVTGFGHFVDLNSDPASEPLAISSSPILQ